MRSNWPRLLYLLRYGWSCSGGRERVGHDLVFGVHGGDQLRARTDGFERGPDNLVLALMVVSELVVEVRPRPGQLPGASVVAVREGIECAQETLKIPPTAPWIALLMLIWAMPKPRASLPRDETSGYRATSSANCLSMSRSSTLAGTSCSSRWTAHSSWNIGGSKPQHHSRRRDPQSVDQIAMLRRAGRTRCAGI